MLNRVAGNFDHHSERESLKHASQPATRSSPSHIPHDDMPGSRSSRTAAGQFTPRRRSPTSSSGASRAVFGASQHAARPSKHFDEEAMYAVFSRSMEALSLEREVGQMGFRYAGDTHSQSKANTHFGRREIRINANLTHEEAALSFAYELANASQRTEFEAGPLALWSHGPATREAAEQYADLTLRKEANSVLMRSKVAIAIGRTDLIANQNYNAIAGLPELDGAQKAELTFQEMKTNGRVNRGQTGAWDHYVAQYLAHKGISVT